MYWIWIVSVFHIALVPSCQAQSLTNDVGTLNISFTDPTSNSSPPCDSNYRSTLSISYASTLRTCYNLWAIYSQLQTRNADNVIAHDNNTLKAYYNIPGGIQISIPVNNTQNFANITGNSTQIRFWRSYVDELRRINLYHSEDCTENGFPTTNNASQWLGCNETSTLCSIIPINVRSFSVEAESTGFDGRVECEQQINAESKNAASGFAVIHLRSIFFASVLWVLLHLIC